MNFQAAVGTGVPFLSFDLDGTAIWSDGRIEPGVGPQLETARSRGVKLVPNSDTSFDGLRAWMVELGIDPDGITAYACESGALICSADDQLNVIFAPNAQQKAKKFRIFRQQLGLQLEEQGWDLISTHPATAMRRLHGWTPAGDKVALVDRTRRVSFTATALQLKTGGQLLATAEVNRELGSFCQALVQNLFGADALQRLEIGDWFVDLPAEQVSKQAPVETLLTTGHPVYHIGDGSNDISATYADVNGRCPVVIAVGPSTKLARSGRAHFVTQATGPLGLLEAIELIERAHGLIK